MITDILDTLKISASNDDMDSRRSYERRDMDSCVGVIDGQAYPISNWSQGGVLIKGDNRMVGVNDMKTITMKFKVADRIMEVTHIGRILRKGHDNFVLQFSPLTQEVDRTFKKVIDDHVAQNFANSQV